MKIFKKITLLLTSILIFSFGMLAGVTFADSYSGTVFGRASYRGYFSNQYDDMGTAVLPNISGGLALPNNYDTVDELLALLKSYNSGTNKQKKTGAAFIVNTMLGRKGPGEGRTVSAADWTELTKRLKDREASGKIAWFRNVNNNINSYYQGTTTDDDAFYREAKNESGITIYNDNGSVAYMLLRRCANPMGIVPGLPPPAPRNWSLTPYVSLNPTNYVEAGSSFNITSYINNTGEVASSNVTYNLEKKVGNGAYATYSPYSGTRTFPRGITTYITNNLSFSDTDYDAGTQICFRLSVTPRSNTNPATLLSTEDCIIIGKKPKVQIWGGDLWVRGNVKTSTSVKSGKIYGSWDEYGLFAGGNITGMASGSAFNGGLASTLSNTCNYSTLTFSNTQSSSATTCKNGDNLGQYDTVSRFIPDVAASFPTSSAIGSVSGTVTLGGLSSGIYKSGLNDITINGATLPSKKWIVLNVSNKNVTINGNITYTPNTLHKLNDIPQLVIIARNITINSNVTNVDAWLIAYNKTTKDGFIKTCNSVGDTIDKCNQKLTINGPVMTDKLYLYRTAGSGAGVDGGVPAEVINLRADAYLWAYNRVSGRGKIQTVYTKELPPRF